MNILGYERTRSPGTDGEPRRAVCRLLPGLSDYETLRLDGADQSRLMRWQRSGGDADRPTGLRAEWMDDSAPRSEFPSGSPGAPVLSRRLAEGFGDELLSAGSLVPVEIRNGRGDDYVLFLVDQVVDCLDLRRSSKPKRNGEIKKPVYRPEALPTGLPAFRLPQFPRAVQWNGWAAERLLGLTGDQIEARLTWSEDPTAKPHPDPWGF
ncbi:hypothetical protein ACIBCP_30540 [Streptomyces sp. NPDC051287]|uniref:hypothetical protein n=1 Tax=Streptomyces sp. NPDC051287 TaxID=3365648 RepID=UPI0037A7E478